MSSANVLRPWRVAALAILASLLTACGGGGGGGGGGNANVLPAASFTATPASGVPPLAVAFNASASSDLDGTITGYAWNFGDSASATGVTANHTYTAVGTYTATLTVTDNLGATSQATRTVQVTTPNLPPTASFQFVPTAGAAPLLVFFDGSQSTDPEGPVADYVWDFGDGTGTVTGKTPTHTFAASGAFTVRLTVSDPQGLTGTTTQVVTVAAGSGVGNVTVSGRVTYERVPFSSTLSNNTGLNYANTSAQPAREIVVELLTPAQAVLAVATTDSNGSYAFTAPANTNVFVRAKAQSLRGSSPTRNIRVLNNTNGNALYVLDGAAFNTGTTNLTRNLLAASGWGGSSYTGTRAAAPFAILDTLYAAVEFVLDNGNAALNLPALDVFWSPQNNPSSGDVALGNIESTLYRTGSVGGPPAGIYVLGLQNNDTDEYDQHVLAHEFNHFLEDAISRTDTTGGSHSSNDRLDLRLAFSEGFANAFSAMVLNDPLYSDSLGSQQSQRFWLNLESNAASPAGWYNETSIQSMAWDLYDSAADGSDAVALGYLPMFEAFTGPLKDGAALTSVYPFLASLKGRAGAPVAAINILAGSQSISATDIYGTGETNSGSVAQALPIYTTLTLNGGSQRICGTTTAGVYNRIGNRLFLKFTLSAARLVNVRAQYTATGSTAPFTPVADPDIVLYRSGYLAISETTDPNEETLTSTLEAGEYVIEVYEWSHIDLSSTAPPPRGNTCFNVSITG